MQKINKQKRAQMSDIGKILLIAAVTIVLLLVTYSIIQDFVGLSDREKCRLSVLAKAQTMKIGTAGTGMAESPINLECHTQYVEVKKSSVYKKNRKIYPATNEENIQKAIANEMYDCWYEFGQGKFDLFGDLNYKSRCVICSQISFDADVRTKIPTINNFDDYLKNTKTLQGETYINFLTNGAKGETKTDTTIDLSQSYYIVFVMHKENTAKLLIDTLGSTFIGCKAGLAAGGAIGSLGAGVGAVPGAAIGGFIGCTAGFATGIILYNNVGDKSPTALMVNLVPANSLPDDCDMLY